MIQNTWHFHNRLEAKLKQFMAFYISFSDLKHVVGLSMFATMLPFKHVLVLKMFATMLQTCRKTEHVWDHVTSQTCRRTENVCHHVAFQTCGRIEHVFDHVTSQTCRKTEPLGFRSVSLSDVCLTILPIKHVVGLNMFERRSRLMIPYYLSNKSYDWTSRVLECESVSCLLGLVHHVDRWKGNSRLLATPNLPE